MGTLNPLEVFPLGVWETIFDQLNGQQGSSITLLNCSRVCTELENVLKPTKNKWLFESVFPLVFPYLKGKEVLAFRRVCKEWCRVVDKFLEDFEGRRAFDKNTTRIDRYFLGENKLLRDKLLQWTYLGRNQLSKFMKEMKNAKNPFLGGSLTLDPSYLEKINPELMDDEPLELDPASWEDKQILFWKKSSELIAMFGEHVKYIKLPGTGSGNAKEFYEFLRQYLRSLPNLRSLSLAGSFYYFEEGSTHSEENCRRLRELNEFLEKDSSSLPEIGSLESIQMVTSGLPRSICEKLIGGINPRKLKCLKLSVKHLSEEGTMITLNEPLPSLTELHLVYIKSFDHLQNCFTNLVSEEAPLGKLVLAFDPPSSAATEINFDLVFEAISKFGRTLQELYVIRLERKKLAYRRVSLNKLKIPHVRSLILDSATFGPGPGFLPSNFAPSLEYLTIVISRSHEDIILSRRRRQGRRLVPEFYRGAVNGELCYSPIWSEMPKLKGVKVSVVVDEITCTREEHEDSILCEPFEITKPRDERNYGDINAFFRLICLLPETFF